MGIGKHQAALGIHDHARPEALGLTLERLVTETEKEPEKRIVKERISFYGNASFGGDFTTAGITRSSIVAKLGNPCPPEDQGSAATTLLENNAQKTQQGTSTELLIAASQADLGFDNRSLNILS